MSSLTDPCYSQSPKTDGARDRSGARNILEPLAFGVALDRSHITLPMRYKGLAEDFTGNSMGHDLGS